MNEKSKLLSYWCKENDILPEKIHKVFSMLELGKRENWKLGAPSQYPNYYITDRNAKPWHNPTHYPWTKILEENFEKIKIEALFAFEKNNIEIHPDNDHLAQNGTWNTFFFYKNGIKYFENHQKCPITCQLLKNVPGVDIAGRVYFSAMTPGTHISTHCGPHNFKLRTHLGLVIPEGASIRVGANQKTWIEGKCIVFDDSFEHEVWNKGNTTRIVLILDTWNPSLTKEEIFALEYINPEFYNRINVEDNS